MVFLVLIKIIFKYFRLYSNKEELLKESYWESAYNSIKIQLNTINKPKLFYQFNHDKIDSDKLNTLLTGNIYVFPTLNDTPEFLRQPKVLQDENVIIPGISLTRGFFKTLHHPFMQLTDASGYGRPKVRFISNNSIDHLSEKLQMENLTHLNMEFYISLPLQL